MKPLRIEGAYVRTPKIHPDERGAFLEAFRGDEFAADLGYDFSLQQVSWSSSKKNVIRGIHYALTPPGQAKYVTCVHGAIIDVIVDLRVGSPTFMEWAAVRLDDITRRSVFLAEGLGHAFESLADDTMVVYLCSEAHNPEREFGVNPMDPDLDIHWTDPENAIISAKDANARMMKDATLGLLPLPKYEGSK